MGVLSSLCKEQMQEQPQVLRLRYASLRKTTEAGIVVSRPCARPPHRRTPAQRAPGTRCRWEPRGGAKTGHGASVLSSLCKEQMQQQPQVLRLRSGRQFCGGERMQEQRQRQPQPQAQPQKTKAGPSAPLKSASLRMTNLWEMSECKSKSKCKNNRGSFDCATLRSVENHVQFSSPLVGSDAHPTLGKTTEAGIVVSRPCDRKKPQRGARSFFGEPPF